MELCADAAGHAPGSPGLDSAVDENWIHECTGWDWRQDNRQSSLGMLPMKEENETPVIPQL